MVVSSTHKEMPQNRKQALSILQAKLEQKADEERQAEITEAAGGKIENRGWGAQIRSYVLYDNRVKDHRTNFEANPTTVLNGDIHGFVDAELKRRRSEAGRVTRKENSLSVQCLTEVTVWASGRAGLAFSGAAVVAVSVTAVISFITCTAGRSAGTSD